MQLLNKSPKVAALSDKAWKSPLNGLIHRSGYDYILTYAVSLNGVEKRGLVKLGTSYEVAATMLDQILTTMATSLAA